MRRATLQNSATSRIESIDLLRGFVMIIMALDHVRDFFHKHSFYFDPLDFSHTTTAIFLTRWITHFCAPVFVFLAGTSGYLTGAKKGKKVLSTFLLTRGIWLVLIELVVMNFAFTFDLHYGLIILQTIWALGISMICLSFLIYLRSSILLIIALVIICFHNLLDNVHVSGDHFPGLAWSMLHEPKFFHYPSVNIFALYPVLPWIGVMTAGYCFGKLYTFYNVIERKKTLMFLGLLCIILFIVIRLINVYGNQTPWSRQQNPLFTLLSFVNTTKYPPSLLYCLMTIGPAIFLLAFLERPLTGFEKIVSTYGRVPMFYYILHFYIIHLASVVAGLMTGFSLRQMLTVGPANPPLANFGFALWQVYLVWISVVVLLYPLCKRYAHYKFSHPEKWWLSYL